ncbi:Amino Acid Transporter [Aphelenchoides fujianensis]|nr:Amino Acid Transporter [Aphelenchoides fujianensis]
MKEGNQIGLVQATAYTVGDIIGSGIFSIGLSLIVWVAGALIATIGCLVYVELGTRWPSRFLSTSRAWLIYPSILAIQTMTFGEYVVQGLDKLMCLEPATTKPGSFVLALYASLCCAYNGWDICCEISNPRKTLPIAGIVGIASAALCYVLMNGERSLIMSTISCLLVAYFSVLTIEDFTTTDAVAVVFAEKTLGDLHYVVPFLVACLLLGNLNSTVFGCSRYVISGAKNGYFPSFLRTVHPLHNSPRAAVLIEVWIAIGLSFLGNLDQLLVYMSFAMWSQRLIVQMALLWMRYRGFSYPKDAFVVPIVLPVVFLGVCVALLVIPIVQDYRVALYAGLMMAVGLLVYFAFIFRRQSVQLPVLRKIDHALTVAAQVLLETELESDKNA